MEFPAGPSPAHGVIYVRPPPPLPASLPEEMRQDGKCEKFLDVVVSPGPWVGFWLGVFVTLAVLMPLWIWQDWAS